MYQLIFTTNEYTKSTMDFDNLNQALDNFGAVCRDQNTLHKNVIRVELKALGRYDHTYCQINF